MELKDFTQPPDAVILHKHLSKNYPGAHYKAGYEAGFCGFGIQRELAALGIECLVLMLQIYLKVIKTESKKMISAMRVASVST